MAFRRFIDERGDTWEIRPRTKSDWDFEPVGDNKHSARAVRSPGYERDPFELSRDELQRLLDGGQAAKPRTVKSPFLD